MKRNISLTVLAFEILAIIVLHTIRIHRLEQQAEELNNNITAKHHTAEISIPHYLLLNAK